RRLGNGWALSRYSIADIHLFRLYWRFANSLKPAPETFPHLTAHYARMMARPAVQRTIAVESAVGYELPARWPLLDLEIASSRQQRAAQNLLLCRNDIDVGGADRIGAAGLQHAAPRPHRLAF